MTVSSTSSRKTFAGDDTSTSFGTSPVVFFDSADLVVYVTTNATGVSTTLVKNTDYTVSGGSGSTGTVSLAGGSDPWGALASGTTLVIVRDVSATQESDLVNNDNSDAEVVETAFDRLTMICQQLLTKVGRAFRLGDDDVSNANITLPGASERANTVIGFNATGDFVSIAVQSGTSLVSLAASTGAALIGWISSATGAVLRTLAAKLVEQPLTPEDFGAVGDGATDDLTPLTNWLNALLASPAIKGKMLNKVYAISGALPNINVSGVEIIGQAGGPGDRHTRTPATSDGTVIKAITNTGFTMLTIAPTEGATARYLTGIRLKGVTFDANSKAAKGVLIKTVRHCDIDIYCKEATTTGLELDVSTTLGDSTSAQYNRIRYTGWQTANNAVSLRLKGSATGNWSLNYFEAVDIGHYDALGIIEENADNNLWGVVRVFQAAGGSATNSIEWRGGASAGVACRNEQFLQLSATLAAIAKGTGTYTAGAQNIAVNLDKGNSTPNCTVETGATAYDNVWRQTTPTPVPGSGAFTTVSAVVRTLYPAETPAKRVHVSGYVLVTAFGTAGGSLTVPLPITSGSVGSSVFSVITNDGSPLTGSGYVAAGSANLVIYKYDGSTLINGNRTIFFTGTIELS